MEIKHKHLESVLLAWAAEVGQAHAANAITAKYLHLGGDQLPLVEGKDWNNQQNIFHRWLPGNTAAQREKSANCCRQSSACCRGNIATG